MKIIKTPNGQIQTVVQTASGIRNYETASESITESENRWSKTGEELVIDIKPEVETTQENLANNIKAELETKQQITKRYLKQAGCSILILIIFYHLLLYSSLVIS